MSKLSYLFKLVMMIYNTVWYNVRPFKHVDFDILRLDPRDIINIGKKYVMWQNRPGHIFLQE